MKIGAEEIRAILDTGGSSSSIARRIGERLFGDKIRDVSIPIEPFGGDIIWVSGEALNVPVEIRGELQRFLGAVGFFRSCVPGMAPLAAPLYRKLSKEGGPFPLTDEEEDAIERLKNAVQDSGINAPGGDDFETHLVTDASASGMGGGTFTRLPDHGRSKSA